MDRNYKGLRAVPDKFVALLAEGVDRNIYTPGEKTGMVLVALLAEGVDRNLIHAADVDGAAGRPPRGGRG